MYKYVLFDLDGTLSDPKIGICTSVQYALEKMGISEPDIDRLEPFIGPPLRDSFKEYYKMSPEEAELAVKYYRERYSDVGKFENEIYPGIPELLRDLKKKDKYVAIVSSKATIYIEDILKHFGIREYFDLVAGSELDGSRDTKEAILEYALKEIFKEEEPEYDEVVMIGDKRYDIDAAHKVGVGNIGVSYGYGSREELEEAGADKIVNTVQGLRSVLLPVLGQGTTSFPAMSPEERNSAKTAPKSKEELKQQSKDIGKKSLVRTWSFIGPALTYGIGGTAFCYIFVIIMNVIAGSDESTVTFLTDNAEIFRHLIVVVSHLIATLFLGKSLISRFKKGEGDKEGQSDLLKFELGSGEDILRYIAIIPVGLGILGFINYSGLWEAIEDYSVFINAKYSMPLLLGMILYGIIYPATQFLVFAGLCYQGAKKHMKSGMPLLLTAVLFALINSNAGKGFVIHPLGEGVFMTIILALSILAFEKTGNFLVAGIAYILTNTLIWIAEAVPALKTLTMQLPFIATMLALGFGILILLSIKEAREKSEKEKEVM
ncbi:MAG: HAD hydrolase-like protein [Lachnospiraceae bacterium]|nr:HAD hydrolase-like protein [Lachnospiraceae bacterium]